MPNKNWEEELDKRFNCITPHCDSRGNIATYDEDGDVVAEPCQFCFEYLLPMKEYFKIQIDKARGEGYERGMKRGKECAEIPETNLDCVIAREDGHAEGYKEGLRKAIDLVGIDMGYLRACGQKKDAIMHYNDGHAAACREAIERIQKELADEEEDDS